MSNFKKELIEFKKFINNFQFTFKKIEEKEGVLYVDGIALKDAEGNVVVEHENFINVGYKNKGALTKALSNLFHYEFVFKGKLVQSIESVFQGIKFKDQNIQNLVLEYSGIDANNVKIASDYDWRETGNLYWQGKVINRFSSEYEDFCIELYVSALQNPLYRNVLQKVDRYVLHSIGVEDAHATVFTRYEFERMLNALVAFVKR